MLLGSAAATCADCSARSASPEGPGPTDCRYRGSYSDQGTAGGKDKTFRIVTGVFFDEAAKALELFDTANVAVGCAAAAGALQLTEGKTKAGVVWPEELDATRFIDLANTLGLTLNLSVR